MKVYGFEFTTKDNYLYRCEGLPGVDVWGPCDLMSQAERWGAEIDVEDWHAYARGQDPEQAMDRLMVEVIEMHASLELLCEKWQDREKPLRPSGIVWQGHMRYEQR